MTFNSPVNETREKPLEVQNRGVEPAGNRWQTAEGRGNRSLLQAEVSRRRRFLRSGTEALFSPAPDSFCCLQLEMSPGLKGGGEKH